MKDTTKLEKKRHTPETANWKATHAVKTTLHEKFDLHQIYSEQIWCKKVQTKVK